MTEYAISEYLSFGNQAGCHSGTALRAVVHGCKIPCHQKAAGYQGTLDAAHPHYLAKDDAYNLFLNIIDPPVPLFKLESFRIFMEFMDRQCAENRPVFIHCNQGQSRAPSLTLLYAAKRLGLFPADSYEAARAAFEKKYPYAPGGGIETFLRKNWQLL